MMIFTFILADSLNYSVQWIDFCVHLLEHGFILPNNIANIDCSIVKVLNRSIHHISDVFTDKLNLLGVTILLMNLKSSYNEANFVDVLKDIRLQMPIIQHKSELISNFDLFCHSCSNTLCLSHDGNEHID